MKALVADIFRLADLTEVKLVPELDVKTGGSLRGTVILRCTYSEACNLLESGAEGQN